MQYTIRDIPKELDSALRAAAQKMHKSLNQLAVETLMRGSNLEAQTKKYHDLDAFFGKFESDPKFEEALSAQRNIDEDLWK